MLRLVSSGRGCECDCLGDRRVEIADLEVEVHHRAPLPVDDDPLLRDVRTGVKSPQTNGVIERFFGTLKYAHLFRGPIDDGVALAVEISRFRQI